MKKVQRKLVKYRYLRFRVSCCKKKKAHCIKYYRRSLPHSFLCEVMEQVSLSQPLPMCLVASCIWRVTWSGTQVWSHHWRLAPEATFCLPLLARYCICSGKSSKTKQRGYFKVNGENQCCGKMIKREKKKVLINTQVNI